MDSAATRDVLLDVAGHMLADGAFISCEPADGAAPVHGLRVSLAFDGHPRGRVVVDAVLDLGLEIAMNLNGGDESPTVAMAGEALRELANMITGAVLPRLYGADRVFHLGIPSAVAEVGEGSERPSATVMASLISDEGHRVDVHLCVDGEECAS